VSSRNRGRDPRADPISSGKPPPSRLFEQPGMPWRRLAAMYSWRALSSF